MLTPNLDKAILALRHREGCSDWLPDDAYAELVALRDEVEELRRDYTAAGEDVRRLVHSNQDLRTSLARAQGVVEAAKAWYADRNDQTMRGGELLEDAMFCLLEQERGDAQEKQ